MEHSDRVPGEVQQDGNAPGSSHRMNRGLLSLWATLIVIVVASFAALLYFGGEVYQMAPPIPEAISTSDGEVIFTGDDLRRGQDVWRSIGGHELGSVWGHGAYTAPTGPPTGSTGRRCGWQSTGRRMSSERPSNPFPQSSPPPWRHGCKASSAPTPTMRPPAPSLSLPGGRTDKGMYGVFRQGHGG